MQKLAKDPHALQFFLAREQLLAAGTRTTNIDGRIDTLLRNFSVEVEFHVTCALNLHVDNFIHFGASLGESRCNDGQASSLFNVSRCTKNRLGRSNA